MMRLKKASLFDLDKTLLKVNSGFAFGTYLKKQHVLPSTQFLKLVSTYFFHLLGFVSLTGLHQKAFSIFFDGRSYPELKKHMDQFLDEHLNSMLNGPVIELLKRAQEEGQFVAVLSSSPEMIVESIAKRLGIAHCLSSSYALDSDACFSHISVLINGEEKADWVDMMASKLDMPKENITIYSDSILDLPFLLSGGIAVAVNPDKKLRKISLQQGWKIIG